MRQERLTGTVGGEVAADREAFADTVRYYLSQRPRQLPSRYFYDALGSALFEAICSLPWYPITRAETRLIDRHARDILLRLDPLETIVELGSGNGEKLARLIQAGRTRVGPLAVHLVDVSPAALAAAAHTLASVDGAVVSTHQLPYEPGLAEIGARPRTSGRTAVLFLGSNIGNFDPPSAAALLQSIRSSLSVGDAVLIGTDLVKGEGDLILAYDDPLGVTAAFNRNLLVRINRELQANFHLDAFSHRALWNDAHSRVEMHLVSRRQQHVAVAAAQFEFTIEEGESIWTESSYKYRPKSVREMLQRSGFEVVEQWIDGEDGFALTLGSRSS